MTTSVAVARSPAWHESVHLLRELARLAERGLSQSAEARPIRESMEKLAADLSTHEEDLLDGLSADLWTLMETEPLGPEPGPGLAEDLRHAKATDDWAHVSALLRDYPRLAGGAEGALLRATCWAAHGERAIASEFAQHADRLLSSALSRTELEARGSARGLATPATARSARSQPPIPFPRLNTPEIRP